MSKETMKLALEAINNLITSSHATDPQHWRDARQDAVTALAAIDKALAQERSSDEQPAQHKPLTDEHIERIYHRYGGGMINCARAIERAAQRTWVGLTDEQISEIAINNPPMVHEFARSIEAKLREKNT